MKRIPEKGKRIVSKSAFAANVGKKVMLASFGIVVFLIGIVSTVILWQLLESGVLPSVLCLGLMSVGSFGLLYVGGKAVTEGKSLDTGIPLTRANTADLPASDSLVRASQEPVQEQETVLLRASIYGAETPPEQMVRAASKREEIVRGH